MSRLQWDCKPSPSIWWPFLVLSPFCAWVSMFLDVEAKMYMGGDAVYLTHPPLAKLMGWLPNRCYSRWPVLLQEDERDASSWSRSQVPALMVSLLLATKGYCELHPHKPWSGKCHICPLWHPKDLVPKHSKQNIEDSTGPQGNFIQSSLSLSLKLLSLK